MDKQAEILITGSLQDATVNIYPLGSPTATWSGITDTTGKVVKSLTEPTLPSLTYGDYTLEINKCDYDPIVQLINVPTDTVVSLTAGCSSSITTHETIFNHSLIGSGGLPSGVILMWHGLISNIPLGFKICNGTNGTPNLTSKFVRGAPAGVEAGETGGADTHTLTLAEIPSHNHATYTTSGGGYNVTGIRTQVDGFSGYSSWNTSYIQAAGSGSAHNNMPAYYHIIFIMKV